MISSFKQRWKPFRRVEGEIHEIADFILHESYNGVTHENDIALIKVRQLNNKISWFFILYLK